MERARAALVVAAAAVLLLRGAVLAAPAPLGTVVAPLAAVAWPPSTLLVSEVQTGGASASDEFAEITNVGPASVDLEGLEIAYVTSTGGTITRKASWAASQPLAPGQHLLIANGAGLYAAVADAVYSGGFAATGGAIVLRPIGGAPIDAVGWGDATNDFVEGAAAPAPPAGTSIERRPGGEVGNTQDSNDNSADFLVQSAPNPQSLAAPPVPAPSPSPSPSPEPTIEPTTQPTAEPTIEPTAEPTSEPTAEPTVEPTPDLTPQPTVEPTPDPTVEPSPSLPPAMPVADARAQVDGTDVVVRGVLTTALGSLESGRKAFLQDDSGGIALYLDAAVVGGAPGAGTEVLVSGTVDDRFAERTVRVASTDVIALGPSEVPSAAPVFSGAVGEGVEGLRVRIAGVTIGSPTSFADGLGILVDDGSGPARVIIGPAALAGATLPAGTSVIAIGPVGQRDSSGTGSTSYRVHATEPGELLIAAEPSPSATATPTPTPAPTATQSPSPTATPIPTPSSGPTPTPVPSVSPTPGPVLTIEEARAAPVGTKVTVAGVVTAEAGRLGTPPLIAIGDATGGIVVRVPDGVAAPERGRAVRVTGPLADPYGQLELRPAVGGFQVTGTGSIPTPREIDSTELGEHTEGTLVVITGTASATAKRATSGDISIDLVDGSGNTFRVMADASSGIASADLPVGYGLRLTGVVGQRASRKGALDGYRVWLRDSSDIVVVTSAATGSRAPVSLPIGTVLGLPDGSAVIVEATVTAGTGLLDTSNRRVVVQDASGAIEVVLPAGTTGPAVGSRLRVAGKTGRAWDAPRIIAATVEPIGTGSVAPKARTVPPGSRDEWALVSVSGTVLKVERLGDRWRAEIALGGSEATRVPVLGQAGAGIPSTTVIVGHSATFVGIVKRPYPTATDRRFAVLPRGPSDVVIGPAARPGGVPDVGASGAAGSAGQGGSGRSGGEAPGSATGVVVTPDTDLATLAEHLGAVVRVGGLVTSVVDDGFELDDGTATAPVVLRESFAALIVHVRTGEAVAATGRVELVEGRHVVVVDDAGSLVRVGDLGQALPLGGEPTLTPPDAEPGTLVAGSWLGPEAGPASLGAALLLAALSALATVARRRIARDRLRAVVLARLARLRPGA